MKKFITLYCPTCDVPFYVDVDPPDRSVGIMGATIVDVWTEPPMAPVCIHVQMWFDYDGIMALDPDYHKAIDQFGERLYNQLDRAERDHYEDEMESRYERWKERDEQ